MAKRQAKASSPKKKPLARSASKASPRSAKRETTKRAASVGDQKSVKSARTTVARKAASPKPSGKSKKAVQPAPAAKKATLAKPAPARKAAIPTPKAASKAVSKAATKSAPKPAPKAAAKPAPKAAPKAAAGAGLQKAAVPSKQPLPKQNRGKFLSREFMFELAQFIKEAVAPAAKSMRATEIVGNAVSGDATFELDRLAEKALLNFLRNARAPIAYYSEESGYSTFSNVQPKYLLIVDPIDGTRAAKSAFEGCVVSIGSTQVIERPKMSDLETACCMEIFGDRTFYAERGGGARMYESGSNRRPRMSQNTNLERLTWSMTVPARPAELIFPTAARLIDLSSLKGGFFACNSTAFSLTRLISGQLDAAVDFAGRYMRDIPTHVRDYFINAGRGVALGIAPYDLAAALLIAQEAGCVVTNAYGEGFDDVMLLDSSEGNHQTLIAAANAELHEKLFSFFDTRIRQFEALLQRRN